MIRERERVDHFKITRGNAWYEQNKQREETRNPCTRGHILLSVTLDFSVFSEREISVLTFGVRETSPAHRRPLGPWTLICTKLGSQIGMTSRQVQFKALISYHNDIRLFEKSDQRWSFTYTFLNLASILNLSLVKVVVFEVKQNSLDVQVQKWVCLVVSCY